MLAIDVKRFPRGLCHCAPSYVSRSLFHPFSRPLEGRVAPPVEVAPGRARSRAAPLAGLPLPLVSRVSAVSSSVRACQ